MKNIIRLTYAGYLNKTGKNESKETYRAYVIDCLMDKIEDDIWWDLFKEWCKKNGLNEQCPDNAEACPIPVEGCWKIIGRKKSDRYIDEYVDDTYENMRTITALTYRENERIQAFRARNHIKKSAESEIEYYMLQNPRRWSRDFMEEFVNA